MPNDLTAAPPPAEIEESTKENDNSEDKHYIGLSKLFETGVFSDVEICIGSGGDAKTFKLHRDILSVNSQYFKAMFSSESFKEGREGTVQLNEHDPEVVELVFRWLYDGKLSRRADGNVQNLSMMAKVFQSASYFQISSLKSKAIETIVYKFEKESNRKMYAVHGKLEATFNWAFEMLFEMYSVEKEYFGKLIGVICKYGFDKRILSVPRLEEILYQEPELLILLYKGHLEECEGRYTGKDKS